MKQTKYLKQVKEPRVYKLIVEKEFITWEDTEPGFDKIQTWEKVGNGFVNVHNREHCVYDGNPFYDTLFSIYEMSQPKTIIK